VTTEGHFVDLFTVVTLCAQLMCNLLATAKFLVFNLAILILDTANPGITRLENLPGILNPYLGQENSETG